MIPPRPSSRKGGQAAGDRAAPAPRAGAYPPGGIEAAREAALRALRKSLAERAKVPNYMIFADRTLFDLVEKAPTSREELLEVFGMGEVKAERFGTAILEALARSSAEGRTTL